MMGLRPFPISTIPTYHDIYTHDICGSFHISCFSNNQMLVWYKLNMHQHTGLIFMVWISDCFYDSYTSQSCTLGHHILYRLHLTATVMPLNWSWHHWMVVYNLWGCDYYDIWNFSLFIIGMNINILLILDIWKIKLLWFSWNIWNIRTIY